MHATTYPTFGAPLGAGVDLAHPTTLPAVATAARVLQVGRAVVLVHLLFMLRGAGALHDLRNCSWGAWLGEAVKALPGSQFMPAWNHTPANIIHPHNTTARSWRGTLSAGTGFWCWRACAA